MVQCGEDLRAPGSHLQFLEVLLVFLSAEGFVLDLVDVLRAAVSLNFRHCAQRSSSSRTPTRDYSVCLTLCVCGEHIRQSSHQKQGPSRVEGRDDTLRCVLGELGEGGK